MASTRYQTIITDVQKYRVSQGLADKTYVQAGNIKLCGCRLFVKNIRGTSNEAVCAPPASPRGKFKFRHTNDETFILVIHYNV